MPIYEFFCPDNNRIYQFYARTLAQGRTVPKCPDNPRLPMKKVLSAFAVGGAAAKEGGEEPPPEGPGDARTEAALGAMEREFSSVDENDPKALGRMMRRISEITGEKIGGDTEEVVRRLEEGADPESLEGRLGAEPADGPAAPVSAERGTRRGPRAHRAAPSRDPRLHEYS
jgi:hypothetical protein